MTSQSRLHKQVFTICHFLFAISHTWATNTAPLVSTDWLDQHLNDENIAILDMSDSFQYQRFHISGARHLPYNVLNQQTRQRVSFSVGSETVAKIMAQLGVTPQHTVIIYDDTGGLNAARLYWELQRLQHNNVSLLDGGLVKWIREGRKISWTQADIKPASYPVKQLNQKLLAKKDDLVNTKMLVDVRSKEEYQGHPRQPRSGHIPDAKHFPWNTAVDFDKGFTMKSVAELKSTLGKLGIADPNQEVILYCRSGHRAAHAFFTLRRLGWNKIRLYDGSMAEYELDKSATLKKGNTP